MLTEGSLAKDFTLPDSSNTMVSLSQLRGKKVILYFYPKDNTPGCTLEAIDFSNSIEAFTEKNAVVIGISKDSSSSHDKFIQQHQLKVLLLTDADGSVTKDYGAWGEKTNYGKVYEGLIRTTLLIDEKGVIESIWKNVRVKGHVAKILDFLS